ncbi:hypothetical protein B566_EDAN011851 [Ephemera danica]|nr:hypothetical protein B566_EDAN011851 [Ephemera danica]
MSCVLSLNSHEAHKTSELLASYQPLDPRVKILGTCFRFWAKMCKIDDHLMGLLPAYSYNLLLIYFLQQVQPPVLPVLKDSNPELSWTSTNTMATGELWVKLFRFYAVDYPNSENVICIRSKEPVKRIDKHWTGKKIAIEDPYLPKRNVSRYIVNHASHDFIQDCLKQSYKYFGIPQTELGPIFALIKKPMDEYRQLPEVENNIKRAEVTLNAQMDRDPRFIELVDTDPSPAVTIRNMISVSELEEKLRESSLHNSGSQDPNSSCSSVLSEAQSSSALMKQKTANYGNYSALVVSPKLAEVLCKRLRKDFHCFKMGGDAFTLGKLPPTVCIICQQEGHARTHCPDNHFPPLQPLPPMQPFFIELLDEMSDRIFKNWSPTIQEIETRQSIVNDLEDYLRGSYPAVKLELFGSSCNGFGFHRSDLDICLTFKNNKTGEDINYVSLIEELVRYLKAYGKLTNLIPITTAKVPIVKFTYPKYRVDCDISLYNTLAQRNTHMLKTYVQIDKRVRILGFTMKYFAKLCDICDASRGSLSSYAYILMVIYFLQQCNPPVIPVLQQLHPTEQKPEVIVEGWNTWFYDGPNHLSAVWPGYGQNTASPGLLWLQMLRFYTEEFDFNEYVVCIRQKEKLLRFEKLWNSKCMAIEDPFDQTHNLGSGLSRKMNNFIIKAFRNGRMHFGTPLQRPPMPYSDLMLYLFEKKYLCDGQPPNDRGCRICKKIGHICKDCPQRKGSKKRPVDKRAEKVGGSPANKARDQTNNHRGREGFQQAENVRPKREHVPQAVRNPQVVQQIPNHHQQKQQPLLPHPPPSNLQQLQKLHNAGSPRNVGGYQQVNPTPQEMLLNAVAGAATQQNNWWPAQAQTPTMRANFPAGHPFQPNFRFPHVNAPHPHFTGSTSVSQFNMAPPVTRSMHVPMQSTTSSEGQSNVPKGPSRKPQFHKKNAHEGSEVAAGSSSEPQVDIKKNQAPQHKIRPTIYFRRSTPQ